jgi:phosphatidylserine decarboxylase
MPQLDKPDSQLTAVKWRFPSVHPEGRKFTLIAAFFVIVAFWALPDLFGWAMVALTAWVAAFFRDPVRVTPADPKLVVAPADGLVTMISRVSAPPFPASSPGSRSS